MLQIHNLHTTVSDKPILKVLTLLALMLSAASAYASPSNTIGLSLELPKPFRGVWTEDGTSCKKRDAFNHAKISKNVFLHRKSKFEIVGVRSSRENKIVADAYLIADGQRNRTQVALEMINDWTMIADMGGVPMAFMRCSAKAPTHNDTINRAIDRM
jgi:hypothetical protein